MSAKCPKCGYIRQPSDTAPDYECPKCGVIYAKAAQSQQKAQEPPEAKDQKTNASGVGRGGGGRNAKLISLILILGVAAAGVFIYFQMGWSAKARAEEQAKSAIAAMLKDPASVQFRGVSVALAVPISEFRTDAKVGAVADYVCGEYNAKNSYGGYSGFKWFLWDSVSGKVLTNTEGKDDSLGELLEQIAKKNCEKIRARSS